MAKELDGKCFIFRRPCIMEDEGQYSSEGMQADSITAQRRIKEVLARPNSYWNPGDFVILEVKEVEV